MNHLYCMCFDFRYYRSGLNLINHNLKNKYIANNINRFQFNKHHNVNRYFSLYNKH